MKMQRTQSTSSSGAGLWTLRALVFLALVLTLWFAGPRSLAVLAASFDEPISRGPKVQLERVAVVMAPAWLRGEVLRNLLIDFEPRLRGEIPLLGEVQALELKARLEASPWVKSASLTRAYPDRFRVEFRVRRPLLSVRLEGRTIALIDESGIALPPVVEIVDLARTTIHHGGAALKRTQLVFGEAFPDPRVQAAARVALEWREQVAPGFADLPSLREVDASNLGGRYVADLNYSEVLIGVDADGADDEMVFLHYGRASSDGGAVPVATKREVLAKILAEHPGLKGLRTADLRLRSLWRERLSYR